MRCLKKKTKGWIWQIAIVFVILFILGNALLGYHTSHTLSGWLLELLGLGNDSGADMGDFWLRKFAHITEYALLGLLAQIIRNILKTQGKIISVWFPMFCVLAVGVLDEFFQSFSSRTSSVNDVILDYMGGILGMLLAALLCSIIKKKNKNDTGGTSNE